jgi:hypothetical protein
VTIYGIWHNVLLNSLRPPPHSIPALPETERNEGRKDLLRGSRFGAAGTLGLASLESILEATADVLEILHAAGTGGLSSLGLLGPVDCSPNQSESLFLAFRKFT